MHLFDIGMIAAQTSRSRIYLQTLLRAGLQPNEVILLENSSETLLPGQWEKKNSNAETSSAKIHFENGWKDFQIDLQESLETTLQRADISYEVAPDKDINVESVSDMIQHRPESVFIYSGYGGVLLRNRILETGKQFLHVHGGYLPDYKGSTTNYYSLLYENRIGASSIFLTEKIDSGPVLLRKWFDPPSNRAEIDHVHDSIARAKVLIETIQNYLEAGFNWTFELEQNTGGETYHIIHPVLKHIAILGEMERKET